MRVLIACEFSGIIRNEFEHKGHDSWSCDLLPSEIKGNHIRGDVLKILDQNWDLMIAHPPCTYLSVSGARWFVHRQKEQKKALEFVTQLLEAPIYKICLENPISIISTRIRKPDQIIQPWQFGCEETKATCLWLKNLPPLMYTIIDQKKTPRVHFESPGPERWKNRSRTYVEIAKAMADQWG